MNEYNKGTVSNPSMHSTLFVKIKILRLFLRKRRQFNPPLSPTAPRAIMIWEPQLLSEVLNDPARPCVLI